MNAEKVIGKIPPLFAGCGRGTLLVIATGKRKKNRYEEVFDERKRVAGMDEVSGGEADERGGVCDVFEGGDGRKK
jgi:hypothetical protein